MLSTTSKYALRVLVGLSQERTDSFVLGGELARKTSIPSNYLSKILWALRNAGMVETARGRGGGYRLKQDPEEIRLIDVVEIYEGIRTQPSCLLGVHEKCSDENPCSGHEAFRDLRRAYVEFLQVTSIATVAQMEEPLGDRPRHPRSSAQGAVAPTLRRIGE